jgi:prepilin-type N-terminal cleavage/methylation domain-containing protein
MLKTNSGFTLIELLVVVLIIGILAAISLPKYQVSVEKSRAAEGLLILNTLKESAAAYCSETGQQPETAKWKDLSAHYSSTNTNDSAQNPKIIGNFNCYFITQGIKCGRTNGGPYSLSVSWPCTNTSTPSCMPRDGLNGKGAKICKALGFNAGMCAEQCNNSCTCESVCDGSGMCHTDCSVCREQCNTYCT